MSIYTIKRYTKDLYEKWNRFIEVSNNGTIFHRLDFLDYHGDRFNENEHHLVWFKGDAIYAIMPMAVFNEGDNLIAKTPYGASFGGIVYSNSLSLKNGLTIVELLLEYLKKINISFFHYSSLPSTYYSEFSNYIEFALLKNDFALQSRDIFNIVKLDKNFDKVFNNFEGRARTTIKKHLSEFDIIQNADVEDFYPILLEDKTRHNNSKPTHSLYDLKYLKQKFPNNLIIDIAIHKQSQSKAGICYFIPNNSTIMTFYMSQEDNAKGLNGTNILLYFGFKYAVEKNMRFFDFGSSSIGYNIENIGVSIFKESFGANGFSRDHFKLEFTQ